jgi:rod shape-determining protein MreC
VENLLAFLSKYYHWFLFLLLEAASAYMLFGYNSYQGSVWVSSANVVTGTLYRWQASVMHFFSLSERAEELTTRNLFLEQELARMRQKYADATGDTTALQQAEQETLAQFRLIRAKVVSNSLDKPDNLITIDKGTEDGVETDMGVACGNGLVGVVYQTGLHYSVVLPVLNRRSRISCAIRNRGYFGYLTWNGGDPSRAYVEDVPRHAKFYKGDWVETSGYSSIFPSGVSVGRIEKIFNSSDGLSYRLQVHLSTDFACLRDVCVICDKGLAERMRLQEAARDSLMLMQKQE